MVFTVSAASNARWRLRLVPPPDASRVKTIEQAGITIRALDPIGAEIPASTCVRVAEPAVLKASKTRNGRSRFYGI
jgi:hypothetical protein